MKRFKRVVFILQILFIILIFPAQLFADLTIAYPYDKVFVDQQVIGIVGTCDEEGVVSVKVKGGSSLTGKTSPIIFGGFTVRVKLESGISKITITAPSGEAKTIQVAYGKNSGGFPSWTVHKFEENFTSCTDCHKVSAKRQNFKRMSMGIESCRTNVCHGEVGTTAEFVHGPVAGGVCIACHNPHGSPNPASVTRTGSEQCFICHENKRMEFDQEHQHTPVKNGDCSGCHDPHQSDYKYQLRGEGQDLCFNCHDRNAKIGGEFVHGPVGAGDCDACHSPHASPYENQLMAEGNDVCFACHDEKSDEMKKRYPHPPAEDDCLNCHDAHSAPARMQLAESPPNLCWECHSDIEEVVENSPVQHPPVQKGNCEACHDFHASNEPKLLKNDMISLCGSCHVEMGEKLTTEPDLHGPVADSDCGACHSIHGAKNPTLLVEYFPPAFYNAYKENLYALCFQCHNADIARDRETTTLTDFRNGSRNLHYLHVNNRKGRSCKACHDIHASKQPKHLRMSVPFGPMYEYPLIYTQTADGGGCIVGCHKPRSYSRLSRR